jgi:prephenate dehydratase
MNEEYVTYLGVEGTYSHQACQDIFPARAHRGYIRFQQVIEAVQRGEATHAVVPVENVLGGRVEEIYRLLEKTSLAIIAEYILPIHHCLLIPYGSIQGEPPSGLSQEDKSDWKRNTLSDEKLSEIFSQIKEVVSHPQGLSQCRHFLDRNLPDVTRRETTDTASAAKAISDRNDFSSAAISSKSAGRLYNMIFLRENIEDDPDNATRFLVLSQDASSTKEVSHPAITTILFKLKHEPGSLVAALRAFSDSGINITKLETYMASRERRQPTFYIDIGEHYYSDKMSMAIDKFRKHVDEFKLLGTYKASPQRGVISGYLAV